LNWRYVASLCGLGIFGLLATGTDDTKSSSHEHASGPTSGSEPSVAHAAPPSMPMPPVEQQFCDAVKAAVSEYKQAQSAGANELKLSKLRTARKRTLLGIVVGRKATDWIGSIDSLSTNSDGKAVLAIALPCDVQVKTWNNALSDIGDGTLIPQGAPLFDAISEMNKGRAVKFSGKLFADDQNGLKETSMTEEGSMTDPEFLMKFSSVTAL
jgi:hypothetical protein